MCWKAGWANSDITVEEYQNKTGFDDDGSPNLELSFYHYVSKIVYNQCRVYPCTMCSAVHFYS